MLDRIKTWLADEWSAIKKSGTMIFAWVLSSLGALVAAARDLFDDQTVRDAVQTALQPKFIPYYVIGVGLLLRIVRKRGATDL